VALDADAVDRCAGGFERLDEVDHCGGLAACGVDVVVVDLDAGMSRDVNGVGD
jgi:hypothetical protein